MKQISEDVGLIFLLMEIRAIEFCNSYFIKVVERVCLCLHS